MPNLNESIDTSPLCLACGLCCDGTLYVYVPIDPQEPRHGLDSVPIQTEERNGKYRFNQPCPAHSGQGCKIYAARPVTCQNYRCELIKQYCKQQISKAQAAEKITQAIRLKNIFRKTLQHIDPALMKLSLPEVWKQWDELNEGAEGQIFRQHQGHALIQIAALFWHLEQHFLPGKKIREKGEME